MFITKFISYVSNFFDFKTTYLGRLFSSAFLGLPP